MAQFTAEFWQDLRKPMRDRYGGAVLYTGNAQANVLTVHLTENGEPYTGGGTISGTAIRANSTTVPLTDGSISADGTITVTLIPNCYLVAGYLHVYINVTTGSTVTTVLSVIYSVNATSVGTPIDPSGEITLDVNTLVNRINTATATIPASYETLMYSVAPAYTDLDFPIDAGLQLCWYDGQLYVNNVDIAAAESWTPAHWDACDVSGQLADFKHDLVLVQSTQPDSEDNRLWVPDTTSEVEVPTYDEFQDLKSALSAYKTINDPYLLTTMDFCIGGIDVSGGAYVINSNKARASVLNIDFPGPVTITVKNGWGIFVYMEKNGVLTNRGVWAENTDVYITDTSYTYSFALKHGTDTDLTSIMDQIDLNVYYKNTADNIVKMAETVAESKAKITDFETVPLANMLVESGVMSYNGVYLADVSYHVAWKVKPGETYLVSGVYISSVYPLWVIRANGAWRAYHTYSGDNNTPLTDVAVTIPDGCDELVVNGWQSNIAIKYQRPLNVAFDENMWKYLEVEAQEGFMLPSGSINTSLGSSAHRKVFPVTANDQVRISGRRYSNLAGPAWLLLKDGAVVSYQNADNMPDSAWSATDTQYYEDFQMTIPDGVDSIVVNCGRAKGGRCAVRSPRGAEPAVKNLNGKTAVVYGTSIFSNTMNFDGNVFSIPSYAGMLLGMDIINEAVGASIAARGNVSVETVDDPYGWTGVSWYAVFRAMGKNLTECQDLIDNYGSKWYDKIAGPDDPLYTGAKPSAPLSQAYQDEIKADSYENKLIPYLDGTKPMPDLFIFEHGHNDYWNDGEYGDLPEDETNLNMSTFMGAMSFYIKKIFEANRNAKILIVSFYDGSESDTKHGAAIVEGQKKLAEYQNVYFCDMTVTGWNQRLVTTTGYWGEMDTEQNGYYWIPSGGTERTITRRQYFIPDDLHPHLDASGRAVKQAGQILADFIKNNINLDN